MDLFTVAAFAIATTSSLVLAMGYCLWCVADEPAEGAPAKRSPRTGR
jgi:hypothetical protein